MSIILANSKIRTYEYLNQLAEYSDWKQADTDRLWSYFLKYSDLYDEFIHYLTTHQIENALQFQGYSILDLYVWQMNHYNMIHDIGKNTGNCNKEDLVLRAFLMMGEFLENPTDFLQKLTNAPHQDRL